MKHEVQGEAMQVDSSAFPSHSPLKLLAPTQHRFVYVTIFGALSSTLLNQLLLGGSIFTAESLAGRLVLKIGK